MFTEIKNRGVDDVCIAVCDGLKGLPEAITTTWELATVQAWVIHLIRNTFRFASRKYWDEMSRDLRPVYTALSEAAARERFMEFDAKWGKQYPAISKLWENAWSVHPVPGLRRRDPQGDLLNQRDRVTQCPLPQGRQGTRALPERHSRIEVPLPRHEGPRPHRTRQSTLGNAMEARAERVRDSVRRKNQLTHQARSTANRTLPPL